MKTSEAEHRETQPKPEATAPKKGWLETVRNESFRNESSPIKSVEAVLDRDTAIAFIANFYAAGIVTYYEEFKKPVPSKGSGELERTVVSHLGRMMNEVLRGGEYIDYHDEWHISIDKTGDEYNITIFGNTATTEDVRVAYERALKEELIDLELIKEWNLGSLYDKLEVRRARVVTR